jgi:hypothetical protein
MAADFTIKQGDVLPVLNDTLTYSDGSAVTLTGATVKFIMRSLTATLPTVNTTATIVSATAGTVKYAFSATDTATAGRYQGIWQVTFSSGQQMTFPTVGSLDISVEQNTVLASSTPQLVSLGQVKDYLNISNVDRARDEKIRTMLLGITPVVEAITGPIIQRTYTNEMHDGGTERIRLLHAPVQNVISVTEYLANVEYRLQQVPQGRPDLGSMWSFMFEPDRQIVRRSPGGGTQPFFGGTDSISVTYVAGLDAVPPNVTQAACELVRVHFQATQQGRPRPGINSYDDEPGTPVLGFFVPNRVRELLVPNRRHPSIA